MSGPKRLIKWLGEESYPTSEGRRIIGDLAMEWTYEVEKLKRQRRKMQKAARINSCLFWTGGFYTSRLGCKKHKLCPDCYRVAHDGECRE